MVWWWLFSFLWMILFQIEHFWALGQLICRVILMKLNTSFSFQPKKCASSTTACAFMYTSCFFLCVVFDPKIDTSCLAMELAWISHPSWSWSHRWTCSTQATTTRGQPLDPTEASLIDNHRLLVIGGSDGCSDLDTTELLDVWPGSSPNFGN